MVSGHLIFLIRTIIYKNRIEQYSGASYQMQTEIIKLNSLKENFTLLVQNLTGKFNQKRDYDVTVIVKQNQEIPLIKSALKPQSDFRSQQKAKKMNVVLFEENNEILDENIPPSVKQIEGLSSGRAKYKTQNNIDNNKIKTKMGSIKQLQILQNLTNRKPPNFRQQQVQTSNISIGLSQSKQLKKESIILENSSMYLGLPSKLIKKQSNRGQATRSLVKGQDSSRSNKSYVKTSILKSLHTQLEIENNDNSSDQFSIKVNQMSYLTDRSAEKSKSIEQTDQETGFLIQNYLNDALQLIDHHDLDGLENFLYDYKEKYSFSTVKIEIKWSLLMAYCKEQKLQFQRASINYGNSIKLIELHNCSINLEMGDLYCHLGRCYYENSEWNKAISSYSKSLNLYKAKDKAEQYSKCITNLGILYLQIQYLEQAQKCFLMAYQINKTDEIRQSNKYSIQKLINLLFNLMQCNIKQQNYMQSQQILHLINNIISENLQFQQNNLQLIKYYIKGGKLYFIMHQFKKAEKFYKKALHLLKNSNSPNEYLQIYELCGLLKQQQKSWANSLLYYEVALIDMQRFIPKQNEKVKNLKKRIEYCKTKSEEQRTQKKTKTKYRVGMQQFQRINVSNSLTIDQETRAITKNNMNMNMIMLKEAFPPVEKQTILQKVNPVNKDKVIWIDDQED